MFAESEISASTRYESATHMPSGCALVIAAGVGTPLLFLLTWVLGGESLLGPVAWVSGAVMTYVGAAILGCIWPRAAPLSGLLPFATTPLAALVLSRENPWTWLSSAPLLCIGLFPFALLGGFAGRRAA